MRYAWVNQGGDRRSKEASQLLRRREQNLNMASMYKLSYNIHTKQTTTLSYYVMTVKLGRLSN